MRVAGNSFDRAGVRAYYAAPMQAADLPPIISLDRLRSGQYDWQGSVQTDHMGRLLDLAEGVADAQGMFSIDTSAPRPTVQGRCKAQISLVCERCLQPMSLPIESEFELTVVDRIEEAEALNAEQAVVVAPRGQLDVVAMIEDELILGLPVVARHEAGECGEIPMTFGPPGAETPANKENPFDVLAGLKTKPSNDVD